MLEIKRLEEGDEGEYKCQGSNKKGSKQHTMKIDIQCTFELRCLFRIISSSNKTRYNNISLFIYITVLMIIVVTVVITDAAQFILVSPS